MSKQNYLFFFVNNRVGNATSEGRWQTMKS